MNSIHHVIIWAILSFMTMCVHTIINPMGVHFLRCTDGKKCIKMHDEILNTFVFTIQETCCTFFFSMTFNSFHKQVNIVLAKNKAHTMANIIIINPK